jgi:hypothetical protein
MIPDYRYQYRTLTITPWNVSEKFPNGTSDLNVCPLALFPDAVELNRQQIAQIVEKVNNSKQGTLCL